MHILWLVKTVLPQAAAACGLAGASDVSGSWLTGQLAALRPHGELRLTVACTDARQKASLQGEQDGVSYRILPGADGFAALLQTEEPDLVHIWGTEYPEAAAMRQAYLEADVFLLPSSCENSPNSLGEAMLLGMPCVASNAGGIPDMLAAGREGLLYGESQDADALARCLLQVLTAPDGGTALGQAARARALHTHDAAANAAALVGIYETILKGDAQ